jgi:hypothetical protein
METTCLTGVLGIYHYYGCCYPPGSCLLKYFAKGKAIPLKDVSQKIFFLQIDRLNR